MSSSFILLPLGFGGLEPLIVLCFGDALFNEPFTIASPFVILILAGILASSIKQPGAGCY